MRTQDEIVDRIKAISDTDLFGFETSELVGCLDFGHAKPFLKEGVTADQWNGGACNDDEVKKRMLDYMPFAWEKANNCRGISASRSISHYVSWLWLLDVDLGDITNYEYYGKPQLRMICDHFGWEADQWDDGVRGNTEEECFL